MVVLVVVVVVLVVVLVVVVVVMVVSAPSQIDSDQAAPLARPCPPADGTVCVCVWARAAGSAMAVIAGSQ